MNDDEILDLIAKTLASSHERLAEGRDVSSYELAFWRWHAARVVGALREAGILVGAT